MQQPDEQTLRRNRKFAVLFGIFSGLAFIAIVYAFVQKGIADTYRNSVESQRLISDSLQSSLENCKHELAHLRARADSSDAEAKKLNIIALDATQRLRRQEVFARESEAHAMQFQKMAMIAQVEAHKQQRIAAEEAARARKAMEEAIKK